MHCMATSCGGARKVKVPSDGRRMLRPSEGDSIPVSTERRIVGESVVLSDGRRAVDASAIEKPILACGFGKVAQPIWQELP